MRGQFGRILLVIGILATLALVAVGIEGYRMEISREAIRRHLALSLVVVLALFFAHCWNFLYLSSLGRGLRAFDGLSIDGWRWRERRPTAFALAAAVISLLGLFLLGPAAMLDMIPGWFHGVAFVLALALQVWALVLESRAVGGLERRLRGLYDSLPA